MKDERFTELLGKRMAGELSAEESAEFSGYISASASYRNEYESLKSYWVQEDAPDARATMVLGKIKQRTDIPEFERLQAEDREKVKPLYRSWKRYAAAAVIAMMGYGAYQFAFNETPAGQQNVQSWKRFHTPDRSRAELILPDGSKVTMNAASTLRYPAAFKGNTRDVYLTGEAYLDVAHDSKHPFVLHTDKMDIHVLGTAFNVSSYAADSTSEATLFRGSVAVTFPEHPDTRVMLKPSEKVIVSQSGYQRGNTSYYDHEHLETLWMKGQLAFRDASLGVIANGLSRKYGVKITFKDDRSRKLKFSGSFEKESLNEVLHSLQLVNPFQYTIKGNTVYVY
ncbi:putative anti-sigma factor [Pedobacter sp. BAL39]|uniref:FecR domain-containing protein n=1 Tax=Pedobacter sp. BAL39 TaxID=391596 RepID=UPI000155A6A1|nr:FecR domain-containing protein [Pedobacter sp. BAL39]EDM34833.1 putative anti-sigma factor [Pedobacter sp. BAL39]